MCDEIRTWKLVPVLHCRDGVESVATVRNPDKSVRSRDEPNRMVSWAAGETVPHGQKGSFVARHPSGLACPDEGIHKKAMQPTSPIQKGSCEAELPMI